MEKNLRISKHEEFSIMEVQRTYYLLHQNGNAVGDELTIEDLNNLNKIITAILVNDKLKN